MKAGVDRDDRGASWYQAVHWRICLVPPRALGRYLSSLKSEYQGRDEKWPGDNKDGLKLSRFLPPLSCRVPGEFCLPAQNFLQSILPPENKSASKTARTAGMGCSLLNYSCLLKWDYFAEWSPRMCSPPGMFSLWAHCPWKRNSLLCWEGIYCTQANEKQQLQKVYYAGL